LLAENFRHPMDWLSGNMRRNLSGDEWEPPLLQQTWASFVNSETPLTTLKLDPDPERPDICYLSPSDSSLDPQSAQDSGGGFGEPSDWATCTLERIGAWQEAASLVHHRWSIARRALSKGEWQCRNGLENTVIEGIRPCESGFRRTVIASWDGPKAQEEHVQAADMLTRLAMCELIGVIEQILTEAYRLFLWGNPMVLIDKPENQGLKRLYSRRLDKPAAWEKSWSRHVDRLLEELRSQGPGTLLLSYWRHAGLKMPDRGFCSSIEDLDTTVRLFLAVRESILTHTGTVNSGLARLSEVMGFPEFSYVQGNPLVVHGRQIELVEAFSHAYLEILRQALQQRITV
jgi:hypothetical protein